MSVVVKRLDGTIKMPLIGTEVGIGTGHIVLMGTQLPRPKKQAGHNSPAKFSARVYCGQTAGWIKMSLGTEIGFGPGNIVLDSDPAAKGSTSSSVFVRWRQCAHTGRHIGATW